MDNLSNVTRVTFDEAKKHFPELFDRASKEGGTVLIRTPNGKEVAMISASELRSLMEIIDSALERSGSADSGHQV